MQTWFVEIHLMLCVSSLLTVSQFGIGISVTLRLMFLFLSMLFGFTFSLRHWSSPWPWCIALLLFSQHSKSVSLLLISPSYIASSFLSCWGSYFVPLIWFQVFMIESPVRENKDDHYFKKLYHFQKNRISATGLCYQFQGCHSKGEDGILSKSIFNKAVLDPPIQLSSTVVGCTSKT